MKLTYKILWLDDNIGSFIEDEYIDEISNYLKDRGFVPEILPIDNEQEFFNKLDDTYDIILTDYHLADESQEMTRNGDKIVEEIRSKHIDTEILFYSAKADLTDAPKIDRISFLETSKSQMAHHEALKEAIIKLINLTIRKFDSIISMRGMIMNETATIDGEVFNIILLYLNHFDEDSSQILQICQRLQRNFIRKLKFIEKNIKNEKYEKILQDPVVFGASSRATTLHGILNKLGSNNFAEDYKTEIIQFRNQFAHAKLVLNNDGVQVFEAKKGNTVFDNDLCYGIRRDLIKHLKNLDDLKKTLDAKIDALD